MKTIGILGGLGPESTSEYYNYITRKYYELYGDYNYPEIIIHSFNFKAFIDSGYREVEKLISSIEGLAAAGADFVIAACNSVHIDYENVCTKISIPWFSIMDAVAENVQEAGISKVGLLGTVFTMRNNFYQNCFKKYGIEILTPDEESQKEVNQIIYEELVVGKLCDDSRKKVLEIIKRPDMDGAGGVILGCTELPFLIRQEDTDMLVFDSTAIHAQKSLEMAIISE